MRECGRFNRNRCDLHGVVKLERNVRLGRLFNEFGKPFQGLLERLQMQAFEMHPPMESLAQRSVSVLNQNETTQSSHVGFTLKE